ncbi:zinc finger, PHD-type [Artemisia annua]|uniref:Zinc finger, PHD-type n=1 Tax=Artemisia annua TaxID=35608 RepID=A0A2U1MGM3_ARTAN|nr:zinc finger, PHD-type [Artemisia annua]
MYVYEHSHPLELVDLQPPNDEDVWEKDSDEDDEDDLIAENEFRRPCNRCHQDITVYNRYYYKCTIDSCDFLLHKFCAELPQRLTHVSHQHPLILRKGLEIVHNECNHCQSQIKPNEACYRCEDGSWCYVIDVKCAVDVEKKSIHHPSHPHLLVCAVSKPILCHCSACGKEHKGTFYLCTTCSNFTIHSDCAFLPKKLLIQEATNNAFDHPHPLTISYSFPYTDQRAKYYPRCRVCNLEFGRREHYLWIYKCEKCMYYVHLDCGTSRREPFMSIMTSEGTGKTVKNFKDADYPDLIHLPFHDQSCSILKHLFFTGIGPTSSEFKEVNLQHISHPHELILVTTQCADTSGATSSKGKSYMCHDPMKKIELLCNGCVRPITDMPFYKCANEDESCNFALHEWCTRLPTSIENHPGHPQHTLVLLPNAPRVFFSVFRCKVCDLPCNGFAYCCLECNYNIDVSCGFIPEKITHKAHPNHLLSRVETSSLHKECRMCRQVNYYDARGSILAFCCSICDDFWIHSSCALLLPETIMHKYDKHPMSLSYFPIENHKSEYFCEIREREFNPHCSFYHCHKCVQSVHSACAPLILRSETDTQYWYENSIYMFVNVKFGNIHETPVHPHPLVFAQGIADDGDCSNCSRYLRYRMIFKCLRCKYAIHYECCKRLENRP